MDSQIPTTDQKQSHFSVVFSATWYLYYGQINDLWHQSLCEQLADGRTTAHACSGFDINVLTVHAFHCDVTYQGQQSVTPWTRLVDFTFQQLYNQLEKENLFTKMQRDPAKGFMAWIFSSSGTVKRTNFSVTSISYCSCVLLSFCNTQRRFLAKRERKSLKSKIISPLSHPAATINSQVIREHAFVRDSNRYFVLMFIECIFWVLHLKHWGSKSVKNCAPTSITYF